MSKNKILAASILSVLAVSSCKKDKDNNVTPGVTTKTFTVPTTYNFANANYAPATARVKMAVELDAYLKTANAGTATVALDQTKVNNLWTNTSNPYSDASLNNPSYNLYEKMDNPSLYKSYVDSTVIYNNGITASQGTGGFVARGSNKIIVGPRGLEYGQAYIKGIMGSLFFKEAISLLKSAKAKAAKDTSAAQAAFDDAFGYLAVPVDYDTSKTYASTDANRPLLWGGYLAERGRAISAGGVLFNAFLKGRAAIGAYDSTVRNEQADIIMAKWEQLAAAAALHYVTSPTAPSAVGNYGNQLHALSEGFGFILALQYRADNSKLSDANYATLKNIISKDLYDLINQTDFPDLKTAQNILKTAYGL